MYFSKQYSQLITQNLLIDNISNIKNKNTEYLNYRLISVGIENYLPIQSQFLYLFFLSKNCPYLARKYPSKKKFKFADSRGDTAKMVSYTNQYRAGYLMSKMGHAFLNKQLSPEYPAIKLEGKYTKVIAGNAPLYSDTFCLETSENAFIGDIPLYFKFSTKDNLLSEISFGVLFFEFLRPDALATWYMWMSAYLYEE